MRDFYPRSPCGERRGEINDIFSGSTISIHALLAESDCIKFFLCAVHSAYFYPRSPCGERHRAALQYQTRHGISIHALLAESDPLSSSMSCWACLFLSTLSLRRATSPPCAHRCFRTYFYPRSPCGERLWMFRSLQSLMWISIHALLAESDC